MGAAPAFAQATAQAAAEEDVIDSGDIVVTATRSETLLSKTPIAMTAIATEKGDRSAAFLLDGVYLARPIEVLNAFYDLARVDVLRGPQGTLYGRNTTAGVINVIAARPKDKFEASVDGVLVN